MTRDEVLDAVYDEVTAKDTCVEDAVVSLLEEIVRLRRILDALRKPSEKVVRRMTQRAIEGLHHVDLDIVLDAIRVALPAAVEAAEQEDGA